MPTLVVQMGHCYRKSGATGTTGEQQYATRVAEACMRLLNGRAGWTVNTTLADENDYRGDAFVAIHCDGSTNPSARGASIGYRTPEGQAFGQAWKRAYAARGWTGGFRPDNYTAALSGYYGTRNAVSVGNRRAFIAECGFRTNAADRALLDASGGPERVALAIGDALGITNQEDDMTPDELLNHPIARVGSTLKGNTTLKAVIANWDRALELEAARDRALAAAVTALSNNPDVDLDALKVIVNDAVREHAPGPEEIAAAVKPLIDDAIRDVVPDEQATLIIHRIAEKLGNTEGN